ncbi:MAG: hypothetical protein ACLSVD_15075 [Eggerthellaceae bacterium]
MRSVPACSVADVAEAARLRGMSLSRLVEGAMREAGRDSVRRLYVGSYFCGQYFLRQSDALWREAFSLCRRERIPATLVVPVFSQSDLARGCGLVDRLVHDYGDVLDEITANDVGMLAFAAGRYGRSVNVGRLLSKEPRDPRYPDIFEPLFRPVSALLTDRTWGRGSGRDRPDPCRARPGTAARPCAADARASMCRTASCPPAPSASWRACIVLFAASSGRTIPARWNACAAPSATRFPEGRGCSNGAARCSSRTTDARCSKERTSG